jgi:hypothetical protein
MENNEIAYEIFEEINEKDDYLIRMMEETPSIKWKRHERVYSYMIDDGKCGWEEMWAIQQVWRRIEDPEKTEWIEWFVDKDECGAILEYEEKNLQKINQNREGVIQEWDKLCELLD